MALEPDIAGTAALFGDPARAAMMTALLDREPRSAGELALVANVSPQTASFHLAKLTAAALLTSARDGRNQVYRLAGSAVADAIESLAALSTSRNGVRAGVDRRFRTEKMRGLALARTCYDHLAGWAGVVLHDALLTARHLEPTGEKEYSVTAEGRRWLTTIGVNGIPFRRSSLARPCMDWSERRPHLAGRLAAQLLHASLEHGWIARIPDSRVIRITERGFREFERHYGVNLKAVPRDLQ